MQKISYNFSQKVSILIRIETRIFKLIWLTTGFRLSISFLSNTGFQGRRQGVNFRGGLKWGVRKNGVLNANFTKLFLDLFGSKQEKILIFN